MSLDAAEQPIELFYSYCHRDKKLRDQLENHLAILKRTGLITSWSDRQIVAGQEWEEEIDAHLNSAKIILFLVSSDFIASKYCYNIEVKRAMERYESGEATVIPVILRDVVWEKAPFGKLQALPSSAKAITSWPNRDKAFTDVVKGIEKAINNLKISKQDSETYESIVMQSVSDNDLTGKLENDKNVEKKRSIIKNNNYNDVKFLNAFSSYNLKNIIGRDSLIKTIKVHFEEYGLLLLRGLGGIGKTTVAKAYLESFAKDYRHIAYVDVSSSLVESMVNTLETIDTGFKQEGNLTLEQNFYRLIETLRHIPETLLILNNCDNPDELIKYKKYIESLRWQVIITSRCNLDVYRQEGISINVEKLLTHDALVLFEKHYRKLDSQEIESVTRILELIQTHTKLIVLLAKAARKSPLLELEQLADAVAHGDYEDERLQANIKLEEEEGRVYDLMLQLFKPETLTDQAQKYLQYFSILPSQDIAMNDILKLFGIEAINENAFFETLIELVELGWLESADYKYFSIHPLVQLVVQKRLYITVESCKEVIVSLILLQNPSAVENPLSGTHFLQFAEYVDRFFAEIEDEYLISMRSNMASNYRRIGHYVKSKDYFLKSIAYLKKYRPNDIMSLGISHNNLGMVYEVLSEPNLALSTYQKSLSFLKQSTSRESWLQIAKVHLNAAFTLRRLQRVPEAFNADLEALKIRKAILPNDDLDLAYSYNNIASSYSFLGEPNEAIKFHKKAIGIREKRLPKNHPDIADAYSNLGHTYRNIKNFSKSLDFYKKALIVYETATPLNQNALASVYLNIAYMYKELNRGAKAELYIKKSKKAITQTDAPDRRIVDEIKKYEG